MTTARQTERVRWRVLVPVALVGVALIALSLFGSLTWRWRPVWSELCLDLGVTTLLGGVLFLLQRAFVGVVLETQGAVRELGQRTEVLEDRQTGQEDRIREIADSVTAAEGARHDAEDAAIASISTRPTLEIIVQALGIAKQGRAIANSFRVRASPDPEGIRIRPWVLYMDDRSGEDVLLVCLAPWMPTGQRLKGVMWVQGQTATDALAQLAAHLESANVEVSPSELTSWLLRNLEVSLRLAVTSRRGALPVRLQGRLIELFNDEWAITEWGIERVSGAVGIPREAVLEGSAGVDSPPDGLGQQDWMALVHVADKTFQQSSRS